MIRAGMRDELLSDSSLWLCVSCYTCTVRCPRDIKPAELIHALQALSNQRGLATGTDVPLMFRSFVKSVEEHGKVHELGMMLKFFLEAGKVPIKLLPVTLNFLGYGRMSLRPHKAKGQKELKRIIAKYAEVRGDQ